MLFSALKMPLLLFATSLVCLPAFFVLNTLFGLRDDFAEAMQAILAGQAGLSIALAALSPFTRFFYFCDTSYRAALLFNAAMFTLATLAGQLVMSPRVPPAGPAETRITAGCCTPGWCSTPL